MKIRIADESERFDFHLVDVPGGYFVHDPAADALVGRLDGSQFADAGEAMEAVGMLEKIQERSNG